MHWFYPKLDWKRQGYIPNSSNWHYFRQGARNQVLPLVGCRQPWLYHHIQSSFVQYNSCVMHSFIHRSTEYNLCIFIYSFINSHLLCFSFIQRCIQTYNMIQYTSTSAFEAEVMRQVMIMWKVLKFISL